MFRKVNVPILGGRGQGRVWRGVVWCGEVGWGGERGGRLRRDMGVARLGGDLGSVARLGRGW